MVTICYKWNDTPFAWKDTPFTWKEGCVIDKILKGGGGTNKKIRERLKKLSEEEKKVLIGIFFRLDVDEIIFEKKENKQKNTKVKIKLKDIKLLEKVQKNINVKVKLID